MTEAERITRALRGSWHGHYGSAFCPAHTNTKTPALSLANGEDGRLLARCFAGCRFQAVLGALRGLGIVTGPGTYARTNSTDLARMRVKQDAEAVKREAQALDLWSEALPIAGTAAENYLRTRGITCVLPDVLRFHPKCWHGPSAKRLPAMVALVEGCKRVAVHRTYLSPDGHGKALVTPNKMMLGGTAGGAVLLTKGLGPLVVAEGIETALSLASGMLRGPATVWAALSTSGIRGISLPNELEQLIIASDGDMPGREAARDLGARVKAQGVQVSFLAAPTGKDWNDVLIGKA